MARKVKISPANAAPWHPGYPFKPRGGRTRTILSWAALGVLVGMIGTYVYATDSRRVKRIAEETLGDALGGKVHVGRARLSIFEGLRLEDVDVSLDGGGALDGHLLHAQAVYISLPWLRLAEGDLSQARIVAVEPHVYVVSGGGKKWNILQLKGTQSAGSGGQPWFKLSLPEVVLREAKVTYSEWEGDHIVTRDTMAVEGRAALAAPGEPGAGKYLFAFKARSSNDHPGPTLSGSIDPATGQISGRLRDFEPGAFTGMLPEGVRKWWLRHEVAGNIELPELTFDPSEKGMKFKVVASFDGGSMSFRPEELTTDKLPPGLPSIKFSDVRGEMAFDEGGVHLREMSLVHERNVLKVSGGFDGYDENAPFRFRIACDKMHVDEHPAIVPSLPPDARKVYDRFLPAGDGAFKFEVSRAADGTFGVDGRIDVIDGQMTFNKFPARCYGLTGALVARTVGPGKTRLDLLDLRGHAKPGTANERAAVRVDGWVYPLEGASGCDVSVTGKNVVGDEVVVAAMPAKVREVLKVFKLPGKEAPEFGGDFACRITREARDDLEFEWPIDIQLRGGRGQFEGFPYPLENVTGELHIGDGFVKLANIKSQRGEALLSVDGKVSYGDDVPAGKLLYDVGVEAHRVPMDATLLEAIPAGKRPWVARLGLGGSFDLSGKVSGLEGHYDLGIRLDHGTMQPSVDGHGGTRAGPWIATDVSADVRLTPDSLTLERVLAKRGDGRVEASGKVVWPGDKLAIDLDAGARSLPLDADLHAILPADAVAAWDAVKPEGSADVALRFSNGPVHVEIAPLGLSVTPSILPVKLGDVHGKVVVDGERVTLSGVTATRGASRVSLSGTGSTQASGPWDVALSARDLDVDPEFRAALPAVLKGTFDSIDLKGRGDFEVRRLRFDPGPAGGKDASGNADFDVSVSPIDMALSLGFPARVTAGRVDFAGAVREGRLDRVEGKINLRAADLAGRPLTNFSATVAKRPGDPAFRFDDLSGTLADGQLAGSAELRLSEGGNSAYALQLVLRDADVRSLVGKGEDVSGRMQASLYLKGRVDDPGSRQGTGDISVVGDHMAKIPILLGLVQVANLSLPTKTTFNNATAKYSMNGARINLDQMAIRAPGLEMVGTGGHIDLDARDVLLDFVIAPPNLPHIPIWSDLTDPVRRELLTIEIRGTIDNPQISAKSFDSFTTTVKQVLQGQGKGNSR